MRKIIKWQEWIGISENTTGQKILILTWLAIFLWCEYSHSCSAASIGLKFVE